MVSVMLYPCILCVALLVYLFVLCVACLTVFANCLVKQFAMCFGVVAILLLNVMDVFSVGGGALLDRLCMVLLLLFAFQSMFISIWVSHLEIAEFPDSVRRAAP